MEPQAIVDVGISEVVKHLGYLADVPDRKRVDSEPLETIVRKLLNGEYHAMLGLLDSEVTGLLIYQIIDAKTIGLKFLNCRKHLFKYVNLFTELIAKYGYTTVRFETIHGENLWTRIFKNRVKVRTVVYDLDLAGFLGVEGSL